MSIPKIPNSEKFMTTAIDLFREKSIIANKPENAFTLRFDPSRFYSQGHCAEFAYAFADFAASKGLEPEITIMFRNRVSDASGEIIEKRLSHCIVELNGNSYDICGDDARRTWFLKAGYVCEHDTGESSTWEFESIPINDREQAYRQLEEHCQRHDVAFSREQIEKDKGIFASLLDKSHSKESDLSY